MDRLGRYDIERRLAQGRTTEVLLARCNDAGGFSRAVAIKAMSRRFAGTGDAVRAFVQETRITGMLHHPNLVHAHDVGEHHGRYYMALEYVPGWNLRAVMSTLALRRRTMPAGVALALARAAAAGLGHAHAAGVVHRDVTPSNLMIGAEGYVKLVDFGGATADSFEIARPQRADVVTRYSAPELLRNQPVDGRADVYSLGALLYELTTGAQIFAGDNPLQRIATGELARPSSLRRGYPAGLEALVCKALARVPDRRFESMHALQAAIEKLSLAQRFALSSLRVASFLDELFAAGDRTPATQVLRNAGKTRVRVTRRKAAAR